MSDLVKLLGDTLRNRGWMMSAAESCTGGLIAACMTDMSGSSAIFDRGFVTYSNEAKVDMLGVSRETLAEFGAVSEQVAGEMAAGALARSRAQIAVAVTGIAGPTGGTPDKPVGLVYIGIAVQGEAPQVFKKQFEGDRTLVRMQTAEAALSLLIGFATP